MNHFIFVGFLNLMVKYFYFPTLKDHQHQQRGGRGKVARSPGWQTHKVLLNVDRVKKMEIMMVVVVLMMIVR